MSTQENLDTSQTDDFDRCCDTGHYRRHYQVFTTRPAGSAYETVRPAYELGHRAATNPTYAGRTFEEVEPELRREYRGEQDYESVREHARHGFEWKTVLSGLALAAGGWWAGRKLYDAISEMNEEDEKDSYTFYESHPARSTGLPYERARTGYTLGYAAARNPDYSGRSFEDVETHLRSGFTGPHASSYDSLRDFTRRGYERGRTRQGTTGSGASGSGASGLV
jgi:hypothetical protein